VTKKVMTMKEHMELVADLQKKPKTKIKKQKKE